MAEAKFITSINLGGNEFKDAAFEKLATAPQNPVKGRVYYNTTTNKVMCYNGTAWVEIGQALTEGENITINNNAINAIGYTYDSANNSFKEGIYTQTLNENEHAEGKYNISNIITGSNDYVDLGLPSGTLWCTHNIGATNGETLESWRGDFFRCCDVTPYNQTTDLSYEQYIEGKLLEEQITTQGHTLINYYIDPNYDPATRLMGEDWVLPTSEQIEELINNTDYNLVTNYNGISGLYGIVCSGNGNTIFLPFSYISHVSGEIAGESFMSFFWAANTSTTDEYTTTGSLVAQSVATKTEAYPDLSYSNDPHKLTGGYYRAVKATNDVKRTRHSIGIGTSDNDRANAVEVMDNGDTYIYGVGGYDGTNPNDADTLQKTIAESTGRWGRITGDISTQADLEEYVNNKISNIVMPEAEKEIISILTYSSSAPASPEENNYYINSSNNKLYQYISSAWVEQEAKEDCLYITEDSQVVYAYNSTDEVFTDITGEPIDNVVTITNINQLDKYKEETAVYTVMYYSDRFLNGVYSFVVDWERKGPPGSRYYEVTQTLYNQYEYRQRYGETPLGVEPLEFNWENWQTYTYTFLPESFTTGHIASFGDRWNKRLADSGKSISDLATKAELNNKQNALVEGNNISINNATNAISAIGYTYDSTNNSFKEGATTQVTNNSEHAEGKYNKSNQIIVTTDYVDLGLPSGLLWSTKNYGATNGDTKESWYGEFYLGMDTVPYFTRVENGENWRDVVRIPILDGEGAWKEYEGGVSYYIDPEYDPMTILLGTDYRTPKSSDINELFEYTTYEVVEDYKGITGLKGVLFTSTLNGKELFFPWDGLYQDYSTQLDTDSCEYWLGDNPEYKDFESYPASLSFYYDYETSDPTVEINTFAVSHDGCHYRAVTSVPQPSDSEKTIHSVGIGTSASARKNAVEVMDNGNVYVYDIGNYDGTNPNDADTLQDVIDNKQNKLTAGDNISIDQTSNRISAIGYTYDAEKRAILLGPSTAGAELCGNVAVAEGVNTIAGEQSHAEGDSCQAGKTSHAEGIDTFASYYSHAEGRSNFATGEGSHAEGYFSIAIGQGSHTEGVGAFCDIFSDSSSSYNVFTINHIYLSSDANGVLVNIACEGGIPSGISLDQAILNRTEVLYFGQTATFGGTYVLPITLNSLTYDSTYSRLTCRPAPRFVINENILTSMTKLRITYIPQRATGRGSHAEGIQVSATNIGSHAEGNYTISSGVVSHAEGSHTSATALASHSEGNWTIAAGQSSHAEGENESLSIELLDFTGADESDPTYETDTYHSILDINIGDKVLYNGKDYTTVTNIVKNEITIGGTTDYAYEITFADYIGSSPGVVSILPAANGAQSHKEGLGTFTNNTAEHAEGKYNKSHTGSTSADKTIHSIGIGTSTSRQNAVEVMENGDVYIKGAGGYTGTNPNTSGVQTLQQILTNTTSVTQNLSPTDNHYYAILTNPSADKTSGSETATATYQPALRVNPSKMSIVEGDDTEATGLHSHAEGDGTTASGDNSHSEGRDSIAAGYASHAEGQNTIALNRYEHAEGYSNHSFGTGDVEYIDLGLPSGLLWAKYDLGATSYDTSGDLYAWGEVTSKATFTWNNYRFGTSNNLTKYNDTDNKLTLDLEDDAAAVNIGHGWRTPSADEIDELLTYTTQEVDYVDSVKCIILTSTENGNQLMFTTNMSYYMSSSRHSTVLERNFGYETDTKGNPWYLMTSSYDRYKGFYVRPVISGGIQTRHSVGIGGSGDLSRRNAYEVLSDGKLFINGVGNYEGNNPDSAQSLQDVINTTIKAKMLTQAQYDALVQAGTTDPLTLYIITNA